MKITLDNGKTFDIEFIGVPMRNGSRVMIEMDDKRLLSEIASDFEGAQTIREETVERKETVYKVYEGYSRVVAVQRIGAEGTVRLTLEKDDAV